MTNYFHQFQMLAVFVKNYRTWTFTRLRLEAQKIAIPNPGPEHYPISVTIFDAIATLSDLHQEHDSILIAPIL
ncbi:hypothetical protein CPB84DRAFT_1766881 [Gymnopilus junonius]|uniref:Uncharacterized protein n=1 Tax=Gymnopilus junonius TaxID=109634 RepID=A0A9P5NXB0_GYMJU|nr:hypothetical protein CPB84DRAFT_1766881 [Gymnopilus junonius]